MATAASLGKAIATNERYAENYRKAGKNPAKYVAKIAALRAELAALAPKPTAPTAAPAGDGQTNDGAARIDAAAVFQLSLGNPDDMKTNPYPGAAKALGYSGVEGDSATKKYGVFKNGELVETTTTVPPDGWGFEFGLAAGFDKNAPYVKP